MLDELGINTAPWQQVTADSSAEALHSVLGEDVLLKRRTGGYDGKGQFWWYQDQGDEIPSDWLDAAIAEKKIPFKEELSLVAARDANGQKVLYPGNAKPAQQRHINGVDFAIRASQASAGPSRNHAIHHYGRDELYRRDGNGMLSGG